MSNIVEHPIMSKRKTPTPSDEFVKRRLVYTGQSFADGKGHVCFQIVEDGNPDNGRECGYPVKRQTRTDFIIGQIYTIPMNEKYTARLHEAEETEFSADRDQIERWSARDAAARHAKHVYGTRKRLEKDRKAAWLDGMERLRIEYHQMSFAERRAMRQLVLEWLEERPR